MVLNCQNNNFLDSIYLRYSWKISKLPTKCPCRSKFYIQDSSSCKNGGFVTIRHIDLRELTAKILSEACYDTEIESALVPLSGEDLRDQTTNRSNEARLDV